MAAAIMISTFGCMNGLILAGARVYYAMAKDGVFFSSVGKVNPKYHSPAVSLLVQGVWASLLTLSGTYNVFEASRVAGVKRVIFASSGAAVGGWDSVPPYDSIVKGEYSQVPQQWPMLTHEAPLRPGGVYGATKVWGEALGRAYSDKYAMSVICLRIGFVNPEDRPTQAWHFPIWCSQGDLARMVEKCIGAPPSVKYDVFYVASRNRWGFRDLDHAREVVGYVPEDSADRFTA
jgi:nucleoside-diphosphate-sugar epimerase